MRGKCCRVGDKYRNGEDFIAPGIDRRVYTYRQRPRMETQTILVSATRIEVTMPRRYLRLLPSGARPSLFGGD